MRFMHLQGVFFYWTPPEKFKYIRQILCPVVWLLMQQQTAGISNSH